MQKDYVYRRVFELYNNKELWIDPYDSEDYNNKYIRKIIKLLLYFMPNYLYKFGIVKHHYWPENMELLGKCFLKLGEIRKAEEIYFELLNISQNKYFWGLPIVWKSSKYIFPAGTMMSTTTSEIALFFIELKQRSDVVSNEVLGKIAYNLLNGLNRVYEDQKLILGYTPLDDYRVNNSNLLVAAALHQIGKEINDDNLLNASIKITNACVDGISYNGGVPYYMNGNKYDSYHQVFSLRALLFLKNESKTFEKIYDKALDFLKYELMDEEGNVYLTPKKDVIDMQGAAEALLFFQLINDYDMVVKIINQINKVLISDKGKYIQRYWKSKYIFPIKSKVLFTRQGELRLLLSLINMIKTG